MVHGNVLWIIGGIQARRKSGFLDGLIGELPTPVQRELYRFARTQDCISSDHIGAGSSTMHGFLNGKKNRIKQRCPVLSRRAVINVITSSKSFDTFISE